MSGVGSNSYGNDHRGVRKFLHSIGVKANASNVALIQREVTRSQSENERVERIARETGTHEPRDARGPVKPRVKAQVQADLKRRGSRPR